MALAAAWLMPSTAAYLPGPGARAEGAELPRAQLDESERHFSRAYAHFLDRDYWSTLDYLDRALKANTYLVDYYLLNGLALQRTGDGEAARASLSSYLEVRPLDDMVPRIMAGFVEQDRLLRAIIGLRPLQVRWRFSEPDLQDEWRMGFVRPFSVRGLGKVEMLDHALCLSDLLGDRVLLLSGGGLRSISVDEPAVTLPRGDGTFCIFGAGGDVYSFRDLAEETVSLDRIGRLDSTVADACWVSASELAVTDPVARNVAFYDLGTLAPIGRWAPPDGLAGPGLLFEPVAVARYANWLAVADRGNGRVFVLNLTGRGEFFFTDVEAPRDLLWSPLGELFVLTEAGELYCLGVDFGERSIAKAQPLQTGIREGWALFHSPDGDLYCLDIAATRLTRATMLPSQIVGQGFLGIYHPTLAMEQDRESFLIDATLVSPFASYFKDAGMVVHSVWNDRSIPSSAWWRGRPAFDGLLLHRPLAPGEVLPSLKAAQIEGGQGLRNVLPSLWLLHRSTLTNVIVDTSIPFSTDDLLLLTRFCLMNGLELDLWAREIPPLALTRASAFTGGKTIFALHSRPGISPPMSRLQIQIPLPQELSSSGYPSRSMLAVYLDIGLMQTKAWMPLWPDALSP